MASATPTATYIRELGGGGSGAGQFSVPGGIATDPEGNIWVADTGHNRIQQFDPEGEFLSQFGGAGLLAAPRGIAIDPEGNVVVADSGHDRVKVFTPKGELIRSIGEHGASSGKFNSLQDIAVDPEGNIWTLETIPTKARVQEFDSEGKFIRSFGSVGTGNGQFDEPQGIAADAEGNVWVADTDNNRVQMFNSKGEFVRKFGTVGAGNGQFKAPSALNVDPEGNVWVADTGNNRVQELTAEGTYLSQFGKGGNDDGQFSEPEGIATDAEGNVWVADTGNDRVQESTASEFVLKFGGKGSGAGQLSAPSEVATDSEGDIWVADTDHDRIQEFDSEGKFIHQFGAKGSADGLFDRPHGIAIDSEDNVWVADSYNNRIQEFDSEGEFIRQFGSHGTGNGKFHEPFAIAIDSEDNVWVADTFNNRVQEFNDKGEFIRKFGAVGSENNQFKEPQGIAVDTEGHVWIADTGNHRIKETTYKGEFIRKFGSEGTGSGQLISPSALSFDSEGNLWVSDTGNDRLQEFDSEGTYLSQFGTWGHKDGQFTEPQGIAVDSEGNLWIADTGNDRIQEIAASEFVQEFGSEGSAAGQLSEPVSIAIDSEGNAWIADTGNNRIQEFDSEGEFVRKFGSVGTENGEFEEPLGIAVDSEDNLWVSDHAANRIQEFNSNGKFVRKFGSEGYTDGKFRYPWGIAADAEGNVWVVDTGNDRVQIFNSKGEFKGKFGSEGTGSGQFKEPRGIAIDSEGNVWIADTGNNRIQEFDSEGKFIRKFGSKGSGDGELDAPTGLAVDVEGNVWVADTANNRVQKYSGEGAYLGQFGVAGSGEGELSQPLGIATESEHVVWVADTANDRAQEWSYGSPPVAAIKPATEVLRHKATLNAIVNPGGLRTTYRFEYVDDADLKATGYAEAVSVPLAPKDIGWGTAGVEVSESIKGLELGTKYHFRVVAENRHGTAESEDETLTTTTPSEAPIAAYAFDEDTGETAYDDSVNDHDATLEGPEWTEGRFASALKFEAEDCASVPDSPQLRLTEGFTLGAWVKPEAEAGEGPIVVKETGGFPSYALYLDEDGYAQAVIASSLEEHVVVESSKQLPQGDWSNVTAVYDGEEELRLYVDGEQVDSEVADRPMSSEGSLRFGCSHDQEESFSGAIDNVRLYDRALDDEEIDDDRNTPINFSVGISGDAVEGGFLAAHPGPWPGAESVTFDYKWERCSEEGVECEEVEGARFRTYRPQAEDLKHTLRVNVNVEPGSLASVRSVVTAPIREAIPEAEETPEIFGDPAQGQTVSVWPGGWQPATATLSYQWKRCDSDGGSCEDIEEAEGQSYVMHAADVGSRLKVAVAGTTSGGSTTVISPASDVVTASTLENTALPVVAESGGEFGTRLSATPGEWSAEGEVSYRYQWRRCDSGGASCEDLQGATADTYDLREADIGSRLRVEVTAIAAGVRARVASAASSVVGSSKPASAMPPAVAGRARAGETLEGTNGTWVGPGPVSFELQWQRCDVSGEECEAIAGAAGSEYELGAEDVGATIRLEVTATNVAGSTMFSSAATKTVAGIGGPAPTLVSEPTISGETEVGEELTASAGTWSGAVEYEFLWQRCDASGEECEHIPEADEPDYMAAEEDIGHVLGVEVVALAEDESSSHAFARADQSVRSSGGPANTKAPSLEGTNQVGSVISVDPGTWIGEEPITYSYSWQVCELGECGDIQGADESTYVLAPSDILRTVRAVVTAENENGETTAVSLATKPIDSIAPFVETQPAISVGDRVGEVLSASHGTWNGEATIEFAYQWQRCDSAGAGCVDIEGEEGTSYEATGTDVGNTLRVFVVATNTAGEAEARSEPSQPISAAAGPSVVEAPSIAGVAEVGEALSADHGTWEEAETYAYQWQRCGLEGESAECANIEGATASTYTPTYDDVESALRVAVSASGSGGVSVAISGPTEEIQPIIERGREEESLTNTSLPKISGEALEFETLSASSGAWDSYLPVSVEHEWRRCDAGGKHCVPIEEAEGPTYEIASSDIGATVRAVAIADNGPRRRIALSHPTDVVKQAKPSNLSSPLISGEAIDEEALSSDDGNWTGSGLSFGYQWQRCDAAGENCANIKEGATESTFTLSPADIGSTVRAVVTATNDAGFASQASVVSKVIATRAPHSKGLPEISGEAYQDGSLTVTTGAWLGTPELGFSFQWQRCDEEGEACEDIEGASKATYVAAAEDVAATLRVVVTATNKAGTAKATSEPSSQIGPARPPVLEGAPPTIEGFASDGRTFAADPGEWEGHSPIEFAYQWQRCNEEGESCANITEAVSSKYLTTTEDLGHEIRVKVTASNSSGNASEVSATSAPIASAGPKNVSAPSVSGGVRPGSQLEASDGEWSGSGPIEFAYQWQRCDEEGEACEGIEGEEGPKYTLTAEDARNTVRVVVSATNSLDTEAASSDPTTILPKLSENTAPPSLSGQELEGKTLSASSGSWSPVPDEYLYQWQRCAASGTGCLDISGQTSSTYKLSATDVNKTLRIRVTAKNKGEAEPPIAYSATSEVINSLLPTNLAVPVISTSSPHIGEEMSATTGSWLGEAPLSYTVEWQRCENSSPSSCYEAALSNELTYTPTSGLINWHLRVRVFAKNPTGEEVAYSAITDAVGFAPPAPVVNLTPPKVEGEPIIGNSLTANVGTWSNASEWSYKWLLCDEKGEACSEVGSHGKTAVPKEAAVGQTMRVVVTGINSAYEKSATSAATAPITAASRPELEAAPGVEGTAEVGQTLSVDWGEWSGSPVIAFDAAWKRCDAGGRHCVALPDSAYEWGEPVYEVRRPDAGKTIRVQVSATNGWGTVTAMSPPTGVVSSGPALKELEAPSVESEGIWYTGFGVAIRGDAGIWEGAPDLEGQWQRCDPLTEDPETEEMECVDIADATTIESYEPVSADVGFKLRLGITATAGEEVETVYSEPTEQVETWLFGEDEGSYTGPVAVGGTITARSGVWSDATLPMTVSYEFRRLGGTPKVVQEGASPEYELVEADLGHEIEIQMTSSVLRSDEALTLYSPEGSTVTTEVAEEPTNDSPPEIYGQPAVGVVMLAVPGDWYGGGGELAYSFQWQRCEEEAEECADIVEATKETYVSTSADLGSSLRVSVTAANGGSKGLAFSEPTEPIVEAEALVNEAPPPVWGEPVELETVEAGAGSWAGTEASSYDYQWQGCETEDTQSCLDIDGEAEPALELSRTEVGQWIRVLVTATNAVGSATASSELIGPVEQLPPPVLTAIPSLSVLGPPAVGSTLMTDGGAWENVDASELEYGWLRCHSEGEECEEIEAAESPTYEIREEDVGFRLEAEVTAANFDQTVSATSELGPEIEESTGSAQGKMVYLDPHRERLYISDLEGESPEEIASCESLVEESCTLYSPKVSPNEKLIAVEARLDERDAGEGAIFLLNFDGTEARLLSEGSEPSWASEGDRLYFTAIDPGDYEGFALISASADGSDASEPAVVFEAGGFEQAPDVSPDGELVTYAAEDSEVMEGKSGIYLAKVGAEEGRHLGLGHEIEEAFDPRFTSDGEQIIFTAWTNRPPIQHNGPQVIPFWGVRQLWMINTDGSNLRRLTPNAEVSYGAPSVSGDEVIVGRETVEVTDHGGGVSFDYSDPRVWRSSLDGTTSRASAVSGVEPDSTASSSSANGGCSKQESPCGALDLNKMARYAVHWGNEEHHGARNPRYVDYGSNNCTNFISQILRAGGAKFMRAFEHGDGSWWYQNYSSGGIFGSGPSAGWDDTESWSVAEVLPRHLWRFELAYIDSVQRPRGWTKGNILAYNWIDDHGKGSIDHLNFVVGTLDGREPLIANSSSQGSNYPNRPWVQVKERIEAAHGSKWARFALAARHRVANLKAKKHDPDNLYGPDGLFDG